MSQTDPKFITYVEATTAIQIAATIVANHPDEAHGIQDTIWQWLHSRLAQFDQKTGKEIMEQAVAVTFPYIPEEIRVSMDLSAERIMGWN